MSIGLEHYLILATALFSIGLYGALAKRNAFGIMPTARFLNDFLSGVKNFRLPIDFKSGAVGQCLKAVQIL